MIEATECLRQIAEIATILISVVGAFIALKHAVFFDNSDSVLGDRMRKVFSTDAAIYVVTLIMGLGLFFDLKMVVHFDVIIRPIALFLNVYASIRLYRHYNEVK